MLAAFAMVGPLADRAYPENLASGRRMSRKRRAGNVRRACFVADTLQRFHATAVQTRADLSKHLPHEPSAPRVIERHRTFDGKAGGDSFPQIFNHDAGDQWHV